MAENKHSIRPLRVERHGAGSIVKPAGLQSRLGRFQLCGAQCRAAEQHEDGECSIRTAYILFLFLLHSVTFSSGCSKQPEESQKH